MTTLTMRDRKALGQTIIKADGVEVVHGRVLAAEFLAEFDQLRDEHDHHYATVSPFRSDYAEVAALIEADMVSCAQNMAYGIKAWQEDSVLEQTHRDAAVCREIERADYYDCEGLS